MGHPLLHRVGGKPREDTIRVVFLRPTGAVAMENELVITSGMEARIGEIAGKFRDEHGWSPTVRAFIGDKDVTRSYVGRSWQ